MKKYIAFYGLHYYPDGGMGDFIGDFDTIDEAQIAILKQKELMRPEDKGKWEYDWAHIYDLEYKVMAFNTQE
jgi:hypothetical protein